MSDDQPNTEKPDTAKPAKPARSPEEEAELAETWRAGAHPRRRAGRRRPPGRHRCGAGARGGRGARGPASGGPAHHLPGGLRRGPRRRARRDQRRAGHGSGGRDRRRSRAPPREVSGASGEQRAAWARARELAFAAGAALPPVSLPLSAAVGRVLADPVIALCDVPHYASSAMDGWAVRGSGPWGLRTASGASAAELGSNEARAIVTGGLVPEAADAVLRSEAGEVVGGELQASIEPSPGQHIRPAGEEFRRGDVAIAAGVRVNPAHIAVAAACGADDLVVRARGRVSLVLTGDEVVTRGIPAPGTVRDSFGPQLPAFVGMLGGEVVRAARVGDDLEVLAGALSAESTASDVVITTGGTGSSSADHLRAALSRLGASILIGGVEMRPGGPSVPARLDDGRLLIGLPGNPLAAMMGLLTLAEPLLAALSVAMCRAVAHPAGSGRARGSRGDAAHSVPRRRRLRPAECVHRVGDAPRPGRRIRCAGLLECGRRGRSRTGHVTFPWS